MRHILLFIVSVLFVLFGCEHSSSTSAESDSFIQDMEAIPPDSGLTSDSEIVPDANPSSSDVGLPSEDAEPPTRDGDVPSSDADVIDMGSAAFINRSGRSALIA